MSNFFEIYEESKIGFKYLTDADLGRSATSHQTHIGLFDDIFIFFPNSIEIDDAIFIYNNDCDNVLLSFDRIARASGRYDSPKIKSGGRDVVSVFSSIRRITKEYNTSLEWFLFWFALKSGQPVFFLFNNNSEEFKEISNMGIKLEKNVKGRIKKLDKSFSFLISYLENIINKNGNEIIRELEVSSQANIEIKLKNKKIFKPRFYDIEKANKIFKEIGKKGEELVNKYLADCKEKNIIKSFNWCNKDGESGFPYDFLIQEFNDDITHLDVKSTSFDFDQKIIFSNQEISFVNNTNYNYKIYRIYNLKNEQALLKISKNCKEYFNQLNSEVLNFQNSINGLEAKIDNLKVAILPEKTIEFDKNYIAL